MLACLSLLQLNFRRIVVYGYHASSAGLRELTYEPALYLVDIEISMVALDGAGKIVWNSCRAMCVLPQSTARKKVPSRFKGADQACTRW